VRKVFHPRDFPHGLRCGECGKEIVAGSFETRLAEESVREIEAEPTAWEGYVPVAIIICAECDGEVA
jgi:hypothetical protein